MAIFCVKDGDTSGSDGFNRPLKKVERAAPTNTIPQYSHTGTKGVVLNNRTGKMETQLPLPEDSAQKILPIPFQSQELTGAAMLQNKIFSDYLEGMKAKESGQSWLDWAHGK